MERYATKEYNLVHSQYFCGIAWVEKSDVDLLGSAHPGQYYPRLGFLTVIGRRGK